MNNLGVERVLVCFVKGVFEKKFLKNIINKMELKNLNYWDKGKCEIIKLNNVINKVDIKYELEKIIQNGKYNSEDIKVIYISEKIHNAQNEENMKEQVKNEMEALKNEKKIKSLEFYEINDTIEDLILLDINGVCNYLKISGGFNLKDFESLNGYETLKKIFRKHNKIYVRNRNSEMLEYIDYECILRSWNEKVNKVL